MVNDSALTVSQLNTYVKMMFESDNRLSRICVVGEISNFVNHFKTGHCYFSLKDDKSSIKAVMFSANVKNLRFRPENGMKVYITGRVSVFERDGVYQIYAESMEPEGAGALMIAFEQLKKKLSSEGLFDLSKKKSLPVYPEKIAVITSPVGAALQDIINVLSRRYPLAHIIFCPVAVQGINCAKENIEALNKVNASNCADVIILGRGGGSVEDLWGYNDEQLVRSVAESKIPVITGIGHETDFTLCDYSSDLRAPTPSAAAELAVPDIDELRMMIDSLAFSAENSVFDFVERNAEKLDNLQYRLSLRDPEAVISRQATGLQNINKRLSAAVECLYDKKHHKLNLLSEKLKMLNPLYFMQKGFVPVYTDSKRVRAVSEISDNDELLVRFVDGSIKCVVKETITE